MASNAVSMVWHGLASGAEMADDDDDDNDGYVI